MIAKKNRLSRTTSKNRERYKLSIIKRNTVKNSLKAKTIPALRTPITYYGGKQSMIKDILPLFPTHGLYCEPFFGGGAIFFAKEKSKVEIINDTNGEVINFYRVIKSKFSALEKEVDFTLHSRQHYNEASQIYKNPKKYSDVKRAWAFWIVTNQGYSANIDGLEGWSYDNKNQRTRNISNKREAFTSKLKERLKETQIEQKDALAVISRCDSKDAFFYCDPPYMGADQGHYSGYTEKDFENLLITLASIKGKFLLSNYPCAILSKYIKKYGWKVKRIPKKFTVGNKQKINTEMLVYNYNLK